MRERENLFCWCSTAESEFRSSVLSDTTAAVRRGAARRGGDGRGDPARLMSSEVSGAIVQYGIPQPPAYLQSDPSPRPGLDSKHNSPTKAKMHKLRKRLVAIISITESDHKAYIENYIVGAYFI